VKPAAEKGSSRADERAALKDGLEAAGWVCSLAEKKVACSAASRADEMAEKKVCYWAASKVAGRAARTVAKTAWPLA
jgi:hypothetical protein